MKYEQTQSQAVAALDTAERELLEAYSKYKTLIAINDFDGARDYLRSMPMCSTKVLCFREIILAEEQYKLQDHADTKSTPRGGEE